MLINLFFFVILGIFAKHFCILLQVDVGMGEMEGRTILYLRIYKQIAQSERFGDKGWRNAIGL